MTSPSQNGQLLSQAKERFDAAVRLHLQGDIAGARRAYETVVDALPSFAEARNNLAALLAQSREFDAAIAHLREATRAQPAYADAWHNLGLALAQRGRPADAVAPLRTAVELQPDRAAWWGDLGNALVEDLRHEEALDAYTRAEGLAPGDVMAVSNRAIALRGLRRLPEAGEACRRALAIDPGHLETLNNFGVILKEMRAFDDAERLYGAALARHPHAMTLQVNQAVLLMEMGRHDEAESIARLLTERHPEAVEPWNVLGHCAHERGDWATAERCERRALALDPDDRNANWNRAIHTLLRGDLADGFRLFECRKRLLSVVFTRRQFAAPEWDGSPLAGRTIFVHAEQGLGDGFQFVRYAATLKARGAARVMVEASPSAEEVMRTAPGVDDVVLPGNPLPAFDVHASLMSLPYLCGTAVVDDIPNAVPYLRAPARAIARTIADRGEGLRVGIVWAGNPMHQRDRVRSMALSQLEPLLAARGVTFFSLQKGDAATQLADPRFAHVVDLAPALTDLGDAAAAIAALDLVITVDTAIAHLAGALGKPVWTLLPLVPDWRWMRDGETSPWYPSMRLFRQRERNAWGPVVGEVIQSLASFRAEAAPQPASAHAVPSPAPGANAAEQTGDRRRIGEIEWQAGLTSGWGTYGLHLALALHRSDRAEPVLLEAPVLAGLNPLVERRLRKTLRLTPAARVPSAIRLTGMGNYLERRSSAELPRDRRNVGVIFFEDALLDATAVLRAREYELIVAGCTWGAEMLKAYSIENVAMVLQGVDPSLFHPAPRSGAFGDRFHVFSGGKLEFRKGQDIVVEAFKRFHATHPDAVLVTAWHNHWPATMKGIDAAGWVHGVPEVNGRQCAVAPWLVANGVAADAVIDLGVLPQPQMAQVLREMDVAVFTNRCEGGTNLVAMEAMACAIPTIVSANTGHLNLIGADTCFPLERQPSVTATSGQYRSTYCWGESDPDEVVAHLERVYDDRAEARRRGEQGARLMAQLPWERQAAELLRVVGA
ncbi:MAG: tetratricopeptide repeat protein [Gemmatimonadetes bacterium]|nr:tetratricopeptide repeat protein [Gemmatimonadota bacterium]